MALRELDAISPGSLLYDQHEFAHYIIVENQPTLVTFLVVCGRAFLPPVAHSRQVLHAHAKRALGSKRVLTVLLRKSCAHVHVQEQE
jgi:hypothetical protein